MTSYEEQAILTARFGYRMLVTVCVTAVILSLATEQSVERGAINELQILIDLDNTELRHRNREWLLARDSVQTGFASLESTVKRFGPTLKIEVFTFRGTSIRFPFIGSSTPLDPLNPPGLARLEEINDYYTEPHRVAFSMIRADDAFERALREALRAVSDIGSVDTVRIAGGPRSLTFYWAGRDTSVRVEPPFEATTYHYEFYPLKILSEMEEARDLVEVNGDTLFLPNLKRVWDEVRATNPSRAREYLARQYPPGEKQFEVFGMSIPQPLVSEMIPALILAISVYFLLHVRFLRSVLDDDSDVRKYPWIGIMPGLGSGWVLFFTVFLLPFIALFQITTLTWVSVVASASAAIFVLLAYSALKKIRNQPFGKLCTLSYTSLQSSLSSSWERVRNLGRR